MTFYQPFISRQMCFYSCYQLTRTKWLCHIIIGTKAKTAENNFVCVMLKELGTRNIAEKAPILLDGLSMEEILLSDPDVIFYTTMGSEDSAVSYMESLLSDPVWSSLTAVKNGQVHHLPKDLFQYKPNARWNEAYAYLVTLLYGE